MSCLRIEEASIRFRGMSHPALDKVSISLSSGRSIALVGGSGSGKSTLARVLAGVLLPDSGEAYLDDIPLSTLKHKQKRMLHRRLQMVFQDHGDSFNPYMSLGASVAEFGKLAGLTKTQALDRAKELFSKVGLEERIFSARAYEVSGGQRQRACLARALMVDPEFLLCDEITSALDVSVQAEVLHILQSLRGSRGILFVTHDFSLVEQLCDEVLVMDKGCIVEVGDTQSILHHPKHSYTQQLISSILPFPF